MFIPISDDNPLKHLPFQYVTVGLIAANVAVYVFFLSGIFIDALEASAVSFGVIPAVVLTAPNCRRTMSCCPAR
jgi:membrane associated rhomboid family serine protease